VDCAGEDLALGEDSESVGEGGHVVLSSLVDSLEGLVALFIKFMIQFPRYLKSSEIWVRISDSSLSYLERSSGIVLSHRVSSGVGINSVEDS